MDSRQACPETVVVPGQKAQGTAPGRTGMCSGEGPESRCERTSPCFSWKQAVAVEILQGVRKKKRTHSEASSVVKMKRW